MNSNRLPLVTQLLLAAWLAGSEIPCAAQSTAPASSDKKSESPPAHTVTRGPLKNKVKLDAVVEAVEMAPVKLEPKAWSDLSVLEAVSHGARVKKGDLLVKLDTEKVKEQIEELEQDQPAASVALELAVADLDNLNQTTPLKLEASKRSRRVAEEDYSYFLKTGRAQREKSARFNLKSAEQSLDNAKEELAQLEKMYKADDLTEETEEIILKRQKFTVEAAEYRLESTKQGNELALNTAIPRENETLKSAKRDQDLALALAEETLPRTLAKKRLDLEKLKRDQKKTEKKLADLKKDLESQIVRAPMDGIVYYGACDSGKWTTGASAAKKLMPSGKLSANEVFITIVNPEKLVLRAVVPELKPGLDGSASPVSAPDKRLAAKLQDVGYVPLPGGGFEAKLSVQREDGVLLMPGMNCKITFGDEQKTENLIAPKEAVFGEGNQKHVFVTGSEGRHERRMVKTGDSNAKMVEVLEGLSEGEKILLKSPE